MSSNKQTQEAADYIDREIDFLISGKKESIVITELVDTIVEKYDVEQELVFSRLKLHFRVEESLLINGGAIQCQ